MTDPGSLLPVALRAADIASDLIRTRPPASVTEKSDRDLVSDVDLAIERAVRGYLHEATRTPGFSARKKASPVTWAPAGSGRSTPSTAPPTTPTACRCARSPLPCCATAARSWPSSTPVPRRALSCRRGPGRLRRNQAAQSQHHLPPPRRGSGDRGLCHRGRSGPQERAAPGRDHPAHPPRAPHPHARHRRRRPRLGRRRAPGRQRSQITTTATSR
jgi:hypothetical protein